MSKYFNILVFLTLEMDIGLGGVPIMEPSETALKYLMEHVKALV